MRPFLRALALALALTTLPGAAAQSDMPTVDVPDGEVPPEAEVPGPQESVEGGPGFAYGGAIFVGMLAFALAFGYAAWRYAKRPPDM